MNKLIVNNDYSAPVEVLSHLLGVWGKLAVDIDEKTTLAKYCQLDWRVSIVCQRSEKIWYGYCSVCMGYPAKIHSNPSNEDEPRVFIPLTLVDGIEIHMDGKIFWHGPDDLTKRVSTALSTGELNGHHFEANPFPRLDRK